MNGIPSLRLSRELDKENPAFQRFSWKKNKTTLKAKSHRCSRAINKPQASTKRAQREPPDHKLSPVFLVFRTRERHRTKQHRKQAITGVLVQSISPTRAQRRQKKANGSHQECLKRANRSRSQIITGVLTQPSKT